MAKGRKTSKLQIGHRERQAAALKLRKSGLTYDDIAEQLGYSNRGAAFRAVMGAIERITDEPARELVRLECERLDALQAALWQKAVSGNEKAVDKVLRIMERRARLLGLDKPAKIAPTDPEGVAPYEGFTDEEKAARIQALLNKAIERSGHE